MTAKRAFHDDWAVMRYLSDSSTLSLDSDQFSTYWAFAPDDLLEIPKSLLATDFNQRPPAMHLAQVLENLGNTMLSTEYYGISFQDWLRVVRSYPHARRLESRFTSLCKPQADGDRGISGWWELVRDNPQAPEPLVELKGAYERLRDAEIACEGWEQLVEQHPGESALSNALYDVCIAAAGHKRNVEVGINCFQRLVNRHPDEFHLQFYLFRFLNYVSRGEETIRICRQLLSESEDDRLRFLYSFQLAEAYQRLRKWAEAVAFWKLAAFLGVDSKESLTLKRIGKRWRRRRILDNLYVAMRENGEQEESIERWVWFFNMQRAPLLETEREICGVSSLSLEPSVKWVDKQATDVIQQDATTGK